MDLIGQTLGNYYILKELGRGGMAIVYLAEDRSAPEPRQVALKVLMPEAAQRLDVLRRFRREGELYEKLRHPRIVYSYGLEEEDDYTYLVLDYMEGGSLSRRIKREGRLPWEEAVRIIRQVAEALSFAHSRGIVHRDVKPSNILFDAHGDAYLSDFGIAHDAEAVTLTAVGVQPGTYHYMAPEQVKGKPVDGRADQFALATAFYQTICGYLPFSASDTFALAHLIVNEPPALLPPDLDAPYGVAAVLNRAHAKDPNDRYPDIMEFVSALERLSITEPISQVPPQPITRTKPHPARKPILSPLLQRWGKWAVTGLLAVAVLFAGFHFLPRLFADSGRQRREMVITTTLTTASTAADTATSAPPDNNTNEGNATGGGMIVVGGNDANTPTAAPSPPPTPAEIAATTPGLKLPTLVPTKAIKVKKNKTPQPKTATPVAKPATSAPVNGSVTLLSPSTGATISGLTTFSWRPNFRLAPNQLFELAFWRAGEDPMAKGRGPVPSSASTSREVNLDQVSFLNQGNWKWGVFLVESGTYKRLKLLSEQRPFTYSQGNSGSTFTSPPPPE